MSHRFDSMVKIRQEMALQQLAKEDTTAKSDFWPNIDPALFYSNLRRNILYPYKIDQGGATNFWCAAPFITKKT